MNYGRMFFALTTLTLGACAQQKYSGELASTPVSDAVGFYKATDSSNTYKEILEIKANSVSKIVFCRHGDDVTRVEAISPAHVSNNILEIQSDALSVGKIGTAPCTAQLKKGTVALIKGSDGTITLSGDAPWSITYLKMGVKRPSILAKIVDGYMSSSPNDYVHGAGQMLGASKAWVLQKWDDVASSAKATRDAMRAKEIEFEKIKASEAQSRRDWVKGLAEQMKKNKAEAAPMPSLLPAP